jgi:hypothetical protein
LILTLGTKKRRIVLIVVLRNQSVFQRLMLLDYQIRLDLASGMVLMDVDEWSEVGVRSVDLVTSFDI